MRAFAKGTLPLIVAASIASGVGGYTYGIHAVQSAAGGWQPETAASLPPKPHPVGDDVMVAPPSWKRWPPVIDF